MRYHQYEKSLSHFQAALDCLKGLDPMDVAQQIEDLLFFLAKLTLKYNLDEDSYRLAMGSLADALESARMRKDREPEESKESQVVFQTFMAEAMIWWGEWARADQVLERVLPLSSELPRRDLRAKCLYLDAFVIHNESAEEKDNEKKLLLLNEAIERAKDALSVLVDTPTRRDFLNLHLCRTYLLLAGLHRSRSGLRFFREDLLGSKEDEKMYRDYLNKARHFLEMRSRISCPDATREYDPEASYDAACAEVMSEAFDGAEAFELLFAALKIQPGWCNRAENDFRLDSLTKGKRLRKWREFKEDVKEYATIHIIGGKPED